MELKNNLKIGILAGAFDPIHLGHVGFINRTIEDYELDQVLILIEEKPRHKPVFASYKDRKKMVEIAVAGLKKVKIFKHASAVYPISGSMPEIKQKNIGAKMYLLIGKDVLEHIGSWQNAGEVLKDMEIIVADRTDGITSGKIRESLNKNQKPIGLDQKVFKYAEDNNLY